MKMVTHIIAIFNLFKKISLGMFCVFAECNEFKEGLNTDLKQSLLIYSELPEPPTHFCSPVWRMPKWSYIESPCLHKDFICHSHASRQLIYHSTS